MHALVVLTRASLPELCCTTCRHGLQACECTVDLSHALHKVRLGQTATTSTFEEFWQAQFEQ